jgi:hypothetical protein
MDPELEKEIKKYQYMERRTSRSRLPKSTPMSTKEKSEILLTISRLQKELKECGHVNLALEKEIRRHQIMAGIPPWPFISFHKLPATILQIEKDLEKCRQAMKDNTIISDTKVKNEKRV